jgi:hypothetical protein
MTEAKSPLRERFETERRRAAFAAFLPGMGVGVIAADTWLTPWAGVPGGLLLGSFTCALVYAYETLMWRHHNG